MPSSTVRISTAVHSSYLGYDASGTNLKIHQQTINTFQHTASTTPVSLSNSLTTPATDIWNYVSGLSTPSATATPAMYSTPTLVSVQVDVIIDNITSPEYATPKFYSLKWTGGATPVIDADPVRPTGVRRSFILGPKDFSSQATLKAALTTPIQATIAASYYT